MIIQFCSEALWRASSSDRQPPWSLGCFHY